MDKPVGKTERKKMKGEQYIITIQIRYTGVRADLGYLTIYYLIESTSKIKIKKREINPIDICTDS